MKNIEHNKSVGCQSWLTCIWGCLFLTSSSLTQCGHLNLAFGIGISLTLALQPFLLTAYGGSM
uniref:Macaca fascicularis brain cDNA clone: QflA-19444, similar to human likely ortholog of rat SNF1/AMP-activated protein kinase(SNARK), mRNA, RefSeq: NM_030952.1 n=1 Tax=Macaca fascicularis TaxID=9541 RepID=I7GN47_MACFA|nr:unnamed protein product [Macaca fascicularis]